MNLPLSRQIISGLLRGLAPLQADPPLNDEGAPLDPRMHGLQRLHRRLRLPTLGQQSPRQGRLALDLIGQSMAPRLAPMHRVTDRKVDLGHARLGLRVYQPTAARALPVLIFLHGGGFTVGSLTSHDPVCRLLAHAAGCLVVAVDYRLAPEFPYPAAVEDSLAAVDWVASHAGELGGDPGRMAVGGDSAGGTLSAVVCQQQRRRGGRLPDLQVLIYPATDLTRSLRSHQTFARGFPLDKQAMEFFLDCYLRPTQRRDDPMVSPLFEPDLAGLPPAIMVTAGHDMLRDEGRAYVAMMQKAGVEVTHLEYSAQPHGFANVAGVSPAARQALEEIGSNVRRLI